MRWKAGIVLVHVSVQGKRGFETFQRWNRIARAVVDDGSTNESSVSLAPN